MIYTKYFLYYVLILCSLFTEIYVYYNYTSGSQKNALRGRGCYFREMQFHESSDEHKACSYIRYAHLSFNTSTVLALFADINDGSRELRFLHNYGRVLHVLTTTTYTRGECSVLATRAPPPDR
jgi:hypothetical protein